MAMIQSLIIASVLVLVMLVNGGSSVRCYECNSYKDKKCEDDIPPSTYIVECKPNQRDRPAAFCRKIKQIIEFSVNDLPADTRIIRGCGWDDSTYKNTCYQRAGFGGRQTVCACETENCNAAVSLKTSILSFGVGIIAITSYYLRV